jgi:hypothetical protein
MSRLLSGELELPGGIPSCFPGLSRVKTEFSASGTVAGMVVSIARMRVRIAMAVLALMLMLALAVGFAVHHRWLVSALCVAAAWGATASLYVRILWLKSRR